MAEGLAHDGEVRHSECTVWQARWESFIGAVEAYNHSHGESAVKLLDLIDGFLVCGKSEVQKREFRARGLRTGVQNPVLIQMLRLLGRQRTSSSEEPLRMSTRSNILAVFPELARELRWSEHHRLLHVMTASPPRREMTTREQATFEHIEVDFNTSRLNAATLLVQCDVCPELMSPEEEDDSDDDDDDDTVSEHIDRLTPILHTWASVLRLDTKKWQQQKEYDDAEDDDPSAQFMLCCAFLATEYARRYRSRSSSGMITPR